jgi:GNAT superfamily N-acetyltransferase
MVEIIEVKSRRDLKRFIAFPHQLYRGVSCWVPPLTFDELNTLSRDKNPAFAFCRARYWLAMKDNQIVGRIAGIINDRYIKESGKRYARFGWFDFIDDEAVSAALLQAVENWAQENNLDAVHGPLGFCDLDKEGMLIEGYEELSMFVTLYNFPYYPQHLERLGYGKATDWLEYEIKVPEQIPERIEKLNTLIAKRLNVNIIRSNKKKVFLPYAPAIFALLNEAYKDLYGFVALSDDQIQWYTKQYFGVINPDYIRVVLDKYDQLIAFGIAIPSLARASQTAKGRLFPLGFLHILRAMKKNDRLELLLIAVRKDYQGKGINVLLLNDINKTAITNGLKFAETGPELETNKDVQSLWKYYETRQHKRRRCYIKHIGQ